MSFDEAKHKRGGQGTQQGGQFVSQGASGTPTQSSPQEAGPDPKEAVKKAKREAKVSSLLANARHWQPGLYDTPEKEKAAIDRYNAGIDEQEAKREWKQADKEAKVITAIARQEQDPVRQLALQEAVIKALTVTLDSSIKHTKALETFLDKQEAFWKIAKT